VLDLALRSAAVVVLVVLVITAILYLNQRGVLYVRSGGAPGEPPPGVEAVEITTDDDLRLDAWFVPAAKTQTDPEPGPAVLVCNGNAGQRAHRLPLARALAELGYHVLLFDYRGYAGHPGSPSEEGLRADARAAVRALAERPEVDPGRVAYFGESLGASVCGGLAAELPPVALILRSPFPSTVEIARHHYPFLPVFEPLIWDRYSLAHQLAESVRSPVLVLVGEQDEVVPLDLSRRVYDAAAEPKRWAQVAASHHNAESLLAGGEMMAEMADFLRQWLR
jgi:hypothetical protein